MKILLFGGTGFIGEYLAQRLSARKHCEVASVGSSNFKQANYSGAEVIVVLTPPGLPVSDFLIPKISKSENLKKIVYVSTLLIYPDSPRPQSERVVPKPATEYERSKYKEELQISRFAKKFRCPLTVIRMANVYGDIKNRGILNNIFLSLIYKHDFIIRGDGNKIVRDYIFVEDAARLIEFFIFFKQKNQREVVNVSTGKGYTVRDLIGIVENITGEAVDFKVGSSTPEKKFSIGDNKKMLKLTNYKFIYGLEEGLKKTHDNYLKFYKYYPSARPYITSREKKYVMEVLNSGILSIGHKLEAFEKKFAEFIGTKYACGVSSGTAGLHLALLAAKIGSGDEVITTPFSFVASANAILYVGAKPVFVDIDPVTYNIDPSKIEKAITNLPAGRREKLKAILIVHIFGQPADMSPILKIAKKHNLKIIEDACESLGATYDGRKAGTFGESAVFAFYPNKQMTTGEGGVIVTNRKYIYRLCASLRNQGRSENMQWLDHKYLGYNYRMDEMSAAVGLAQLEKLDWLLKERKIAAWYNEFLAPYGDLIQVPQVHPCNTHTWFVYVVCVKNKKVNRNRVIEYLNKIGVSTKAYLPSIHLLNFYRKTFGFKPGDFPVCEAVSNSAVALPFYIGLKRADIEYISKTLAEVIKKYAKRV